MRLVFYLQYVPHYLCICRYVILQADQTFPSPIPPIPSNCVQTATILEFSGFVLFVGFWVVVVFGFFLNMNKSIFLVANVLTPSQHKYRALAASYLSFIVNYIFAKFSY